MDVTNPWRIFNIWKNTWGTKHEHLKKTPQYDCQTQKPLSLLDTSFHLLWWLLWHWLTNFDDKTIFFYLKEIIRSNLFYFLSTILIFVLQSKHLSESVAGTLISDILLHFISLHMADIHSTRYIWYFWHDCRKTWDTNFKLKIPFSHLSDILQFSLRAFTQGHFRKSTNEWT